MPVVVCLFVYGITFSHSKLVMRVLPAATVAKSLEGNEVVLLDEAGGGRGRLDSNINKLLSGMIVS